MDQIVNILGFQFIHCHNYYESVLGWPKNSFDFFRNIFWKSPKELFGQPNSLKAAIDNVYMNGWASQVVLVIKNPSADPGDVRDVGLIPGSGRSPGGGHSNPLQCSFLENPMDRGAWRATVHKVAKSRTRVKHLSTQAQMNGCSFVPVKLYQQKQAGGQIWLKTCSLLTPTLKHYTNTSHPWSRSGNAGHKPEAQKPMRGPLLSLTSSSYSSRLSLLQPHSLLAALQTNLHPTASGPLHSLFPAWSVCSLSSPLGLQAHRLLSSAPLSTLGESFSEYPIKTYSTHSGQYFLSLSPAFFLSVVLITIRKRYHFTNTFHMFSVCALEH